MLVCSRELLTADRTYFVRTDGNDSNSGLVDSSAGAFLTIAKAIGVVWDTLDLGGYTVTIKIGDGTYTASTPVYGLLNGRGTVRLRGNVSSPQNVVIQTTGANCFTFHEDAAAWVEDMELRTVTSGSCLSVNGGAWVRFQNVRFGQAATGHLAVFDSGTNVVAIGNYSIVGSAPVHANTGLSCQLSIRNRTITLVGTPNWSTSFVFGLSSASLIMDGNTFSGAATGKRFQVEANAVLQTFGASATYLPGSVNGTTATGGQYL
jgi:hypothetical protein